MSQFTCEVVRVKIEPHPNADAIEIARVGDFQSIVRKGQVRDGDLAVYIPEQAVVPEWLLRQMNLWDEAKQKGGLHGAAGNRVKAIKLRGVLSQGLILPGNCGDDANPDIVVVSANRSENNVPEFVPATVDPIGVWEARGFSEGDDVAEFLGVTKYEPALPSHMRARIIGVDYDATHGYDFDNLKKKPTLFEDGEDVVITEKIHGTFIQVGVVPSSAANEKYYGGRVIVSSKGMGAKGFVLDHNDETNLYAQAAKKHNLFDIMLGRMGPLADVAGKPVFLMGEVFGRTLNGKDVQDGMSYNDEPLAFRAFDICVGNRGVEQYMTHNEFRTFCDLNGVPRVPVLYRGPYSKKVVLDYTDGFTTLADKQQIREGVVVKSAVEARNPHYGRKIAKSVSEAYLLRKGGTEFQ